MSSDEVQSLDGFVCAGAVASPRAQPAAFGATSRSTPACIRRRTFRETGYAPAPERTGVVRGGSTTAVYLGQTRTSLAKRLGSNGYATISTYNTLAREPGRTNGGQQTNCRVNGLANAALAMGANLSIWYRLTAADEALAEEAHWMAAFGKPEWNRRLEASAGR